MDQKSLDDAIYDHCIVVRIIFKLKVFLRKGDWNMRPLGLDERSFSPTCCTLLCASFFCFLLAGSELEPPVIGSTSFVDEGAIAWLPCEVIDAIVEVSSPKVGANVGHLFSNVVNQE